MRGRINRRESLKFWWKRRERRGSDLVDGQKHACRAITAVHLGSSRADISVGCVNAVFRGCVGEEKGYGHVGEVANGAQSTCLPSLACFAGRVYRHTVWACVCTRVCVHTSWNCARAYVHRHRTRTTAVNTARALLLHGCLPRCHCRTNIAPISGASIQLRHDSTILPFFPLNFFPFSFSLDCLLVLVNEYDRKSNRRKEKINFTHRASMFLTLPIFMVLAFPIYVRRLSIEGLSLKEKRRGKRKEPLIWNSNGNRYDRWIEAESRHVEDP